MLARIRPARADDGRALQDIERLAGERFREVGLPEVADDDPAPVDVLAAYAAAGRSWVAADPLDVPVGYVLGDLGPGLRAVRDREASHGLDPSTRVCMRLQLAG